MGNCSSSGESKPAAQHRAREAVNNPAPKKVARQPLGPSSRPVNDLNVSSKQIDDDDDDEALDSTTKMTRGQLSTMRLNTTISRRARSNTMRSNDASIRPTVTTEEPNSLAGVDPIISPHSQAMATDRLESSSMTSTTRGRSNTMRLEASGKRTRSNTMRSQGGGPAKSWEVTPSASTTLEGRVEQKAHVASPTNGDGDLPLLGSPSSLSRSGKNQASPINSELPLSRSISVLSNSGDIPICRNPSALSETGHFDMSISRCPSGLSNTSKSPRVTNRPSALSLQPVTPREMGGAPRSPVNTGLVPRSPGPRSPSNSSLAPRSPGPVARRSRSNTVMAPRSSGQVPRSPGQICRSPGQVPRSPGNGALNAVALSDMGIPADRCAPVSPLISNNELSMSRQASVMSNTAGRRARPSPLSFDLPASHSPSALNLQSGNSGVAPLDNAPNAPVTPLLWDNQSDDVFEETLLKKSGKGAPLETWKEHRWPWVWELAVAPEPKTASTTDYTDFLRCYRILQKDEVHAHDAWMRGEDDAAREILRDPRGQSLLSPGLDAAASPSVATPKSPLSPTSPFESSGRFGDSSSTFGGSTNVSPSNRPRAGEYRKQDNVFNPRATDASSYRITPHAKTAEEEEVIVTAIKACPLFAHLKRAEEISALVAGMRRMGPYAKGQDVLKRGYMVPPGHNGLFVITRGSILRDNRDILGPGHTFGEHLVTSTDTRARNGVVSQGNLELFILENEVFNGIMGRLANDKREQYKEWLMGMEILRNLTSVQLLQLADALEEKKYQPGEKLVEFSKRSDYMHFIVDGEVDVWGREESQGVLLPNQKRYICTLSSGQPIGHRECFDENPMPSIADVVAKDDVITARISRSHFERYRGRLHSSSAGRDQRKTRP
ncbi:cAMP-dependent protein kinase regulatory subunit [Diplonema papillatum]|nr:cAMP-dependent protein kinase regulatory subunit [Diplonema papillatum]